MLCFGAAVFHFPRTKDAFPAVAIMALADRGRSTRSDRSWPAPQRAKDSQKCPNTQKKTGAIPEIEREKKLLSDYGDVLDRLEGNSSEPNN